jgi:uncharacterized membrane protein YjfL (UPF0719 family)
MPIVRVNDKGDKIAEIKRKRNTKIAAAVALVGSVVSFALFFFHSAEAGIFAGLWPATIVSVLNLVDD